MEIVFGLFGLGLLIVLIICGDSLYRAEQTAMARKQETQRREAQELHERRIALVKGCIADHEEALLRMTRRSLSHDAYGNVNYGRFDKEIAYFFDNVVSQDLAPYSPYEREFWCGMIATILESMASDSEVEEHSAPSLDGVDYERSIGGLLAKAGFAIQYTPASGDQGVDVIAERGPSRIAIQCKNYRAAVGNDAVQQVFAGASFHGASHALVVAPAGFTRSALDLARSLGIRCLHHDELVGHLVSLTEAEGLAAPQR